MIRIGKSKKTIESWHCEISIPFYPMKSRRQRATRAVVGEPVSGGTGLALTGSSLFATRPPLRAALARVRELVIPGWWFSTCSGCKRCSCLLPFYSENTRVLTHLFFSVTHSLCNCLCTHTPKSPQKSFRVSLSLEKFSSPDTKKALYMLIIPFP